MKQIKQYKESLHDDGVEMRYDVDTDTVYIMRSKGGGAIELHSSILPKIAEFLATAKAQEEDEKAKINPAP